MKSPESPTIKLFDHTFGPEFLRDVPHLPGIYEFLDDSGKTIYVGKAKDLRNRLGQYRNTRIAEDNSKVRRMLKAASSVQFQLCESDLEAQLLENKLIQELRPKYNWQGTTYEGYPCIGLKRITASEWEVCKTRSPAWAREVGYRLYGCYRRKDLVEILYESLNGLLGLTGKRVMMNHSWYVGLPKKSERMRVQHLDSRLMQQLQTMLLGESQGFIGAIAQRLLEDANARHRSTDVQGWLEGVRQFYKHEAAISAGIRAANDDPSDFIPQEMRDRMQIIYRMKTS